ncbi:conserved hypothetical protein (plasmid) [Gloeothece citriformis PCC 7424]|uniref:Uncharacterized protein n=1 Tax=Gloeothece citriformis (strain PCC 7424) TaxID=65393 RepID=B7KLR3_GLOC7|nr:hypothetical protein [Gloeothece citriformis]ACK73735.1 conserved hypothetical protein [Gloeothece citriformis PCC 7424]
MAGKTISAYTDAETASRLGIIAKVEQRTQAQIGGMALKLFVSLPKEAREALWQVKTLGNEQDWESLIKEITRTLLNVQYKLATQQVVEQMKVEELGNLESEDEILQAAVNLTCNE